MALLSDTSCKQIFTFPEMAKELLCAAVEQRWARAVPLKAFERVNASYVSATGTQRHDDLVWRLERVRNDDLYLLVEFQSRPDLLMAERMHAYTALLSEELAKQGKVQAAQILPIVLYTGQRPWHVKTIVSTVSLLPPGLESFESQFSYLLIDVESIVDQSNIVYLLLALNQVKHPEKFRSLLEKIEPMARTSI
ncbi:Rpn family recombination-promoting nuclease/putative transposase [Massilia eburnea]|nr:Rpn family recombination-promoting nuclease/putative transposase [Massilia eburnea]